MVDLRQFAASMSRTPPAPAPASPSAARTRQWRRRQGIEPRPENRVCKGCGGDLPSCRWQWCSDLCRLPVTQVRIPNCATCGKPFVAHGVRLKAATCGPDCHRKHESALHAARARHREHLKRTGLSDITPEQEAEMRRRARKCPLCGVRLTNKLGLPNSKHLDHILPISQGGTHTHGNCRILCRDCNLRRPKDGSDFTGQLTLWAQGPAPVSRPDRRRNGANTNKATCRKGLHPWIPANITIVKGGKKRCRLCREAKELTRYPRHTCKCGAEFAAPGKTFMCPDCVEATARRAAELHACGGVTWEQVAAEVGYGTAEGARYAAERIGYKSGLRRADAKAARPCQYCGKRAEDTRGQRHPTCLACTEDRAWRAVELQRSGATLRAIADELGYGSITSVTNLMKNVVVIESRMGRPAKHS